MLPPSYAGLARYLFGSGQFEYGLRLEEAWWLLLSSAEDPAAELGRAYRFNTRWQEAHPLALTVFGRDNFVAWIAQTYDVRAAAAWLDPATWPDVPDPAEQLRLGYAWVARLAPGAPPCLRRHGRGDGAARLAGEPRGGTPSGVAALVRGRDADSAGG
jgi:hypothetical protein